MRWPFSRKPRSRRPTMRVYRPAGRERTRTRGDALHAELARLTHELPAVAEQEGLTAAGELIRHGQATYLRRLIMPWQIRAFGYYDMLGEIKFAAQFYSRSLSQLELFAAEFDENGEIVPTDNEDAKAALARVKDPGGGGRTNLLAAYGRLMFLVGEAILFCTINPFTGLEQWEMLSTDELRLLDGNYTRFMAPVLPAVNFRPAPDDCFEPVEGTAVAYRLWKRHPRFTALADSTMEGVLDIAEELVLLTQVVRARARSRLAGNGILFLDERITTKPTEAVPDEDPFEDPFFADLISAMTSPITDEGTAGAVVPLVARVKVPDNMKLSDLVYHLKLVDPMQLYPEVGLREECIRRLAIGLDMPPEILLGLGAESNHWSAWAIDEQSWKAHLKPVADQLVQDMTSAYLQPYLKDQGVKDWDKYVIAYDASAIINHPDRAKDAKDLFDRVAISHQALRVATGFDEDDAPSEDERAERIGILTRDSSLAWFGIPAPRGGAVEVAPGEVKSDQVGDTDTTPGASTGGEVEAGPPKAGTPAEREGEQDNSVVGSLSARAEGAACAAIIRAREAAGNRLRQAANRQSRGKPSDLTRLIDGVEATLVAATLGRERVIELVGAEEEAKLCGCSRDYTVLALRQAGGVKKDVHAAIIADMLERFLARTLYDAAPSPVPPNFRSFLAGVLTK